MPRYFDIETTGLNQRKDRIGFVNMDGKCLYGGEAGEDEIVKTTIEWLMPRKDDHLDRAFQVWPILGKNLTFDVEFLKARCRYHALSFNLSAFYRYYMKIDLRDIAIIWNDGEGKNYNSWIDQADKVNGSEVAKWVQAGDWTRIREYSMKEREAAFHFYDWVRSVRPDRSQRPY